MSVQKVIPWKYNIRTTSELTLISYLGQPNISYAHNINSDHTVDNIKSVNAFMIVFIIKNTSLRNIVEIWSSSQVNCGSGLIIV